MCTSGDLGKDDTLAQDGKGLAYSIVIKLLEGLEERGHHVYMDNWYTSTALFDELSARGFGACGTIRSNRKGIRIATSELSWHSNYCKMLEAHIQSNKCMVHIILHCLFTIALQSVIS